MIAWVAVGGAGDAALDLRVRDPLGQRRERLRRLVAGLHLQARPVDGAAVEPRRRAGLQPAERKPKPLERRDKPSRRRLADPAGRRLLLADMDQAAQERAGGQNHRAGARIRGHRPAGRPSRGRFRAIRSSASPSITVRFGGFADRRLHGGGVELAVGLGARAAHRRTLAAVEHPELDAAAGRRPGPSGRPAHRSRGPDGPCRARRSPDCRTSRRWSRTGGSPARSSRPCARPPPRLRSRHGRRR